MSPKTALARKCYQVTSYFTVTFDISPVFVCSTVLLISAPPALTLAQVCLFLGLLSSVLLCSSLQYCLSTDNASRLRGRFRTTYQPNDFLGILHLHTSAHAALRHCGPSFLAVMIRTELRRFFWDPIVSALDYITPHVKGP